MFNPHVIKSHFGKIIQFTIGSSVLLLLISFTIVFIGNIFYLYEKTSFSDFQKYEHKDTLPTDINSRTWMNIAMSIVKQENVSQAYASRFYAYVTTVYAETLIETGNEDAASLATAWIIMDIFPPYSSFILDTLEQFGISRTQGINMPGDNVLSKYRFQTQNDKAVSKDDTNRENQFNSDFLKENIQIAEWKPWINNQSLLKNLPSSFDSSILNDLNEHIKSNYAKKSLDKKSLKAVMYWLGIDEIDGSSVGENIRYSGIWQNILFTEIGGKIRDPEYANAQFILAQSLTDAILYSHKIAGDYVSEAQAKIFSENNITSNYRLMPGDILAPAAAAGAGRTILTHLFPEKKDVWDRKAKDLINANFVSGSSFDIYNTLGEYIGTLAAKQHIKNGEAKIDTLILSETSIYEKALNIASNFIIAGIPNFNKNDTLPSSFEDKLDESGIRTLPYSRGATWWDLNRDGLEDLLISGSIPKIYINKGNGYFTESPRNLGIKDFLSGAMAIVGNFDKDNCPDILTVSSPNVYTPQLYKNDCNNGFTNVTKKAGFKTANQGQGAAAADFNDDGMLDIYIANHGYILPPDYLYTPNNLYVNNGDGTFTDIAESAGVDGLAECPEINFERGGDQNRIVYKKGQKVKLSFQPVWLDYNDDNNIDLFVTTDSGISPLYRNNGDGTFTDVTAEAGLCLPGTGMGVALGDYDNDLDTDLYVTNTGQNYFWHNNGDGTFNQVSQLNGTANLTSVGWGTGFFDYDNDGFLDLYVANGNVSQETKEYLQKETIDKLYKNNGFGGFVDVTKKEGISGNNPKEAMAFSDSNNDGFADIVVISAHADDKPRNRLYLNNPNGNNWLKIKLNGKTVNKDAVGAKIVLSSGDKKQMRVVTMGDSFLGQNSLIQNFGLGKQSSIDSIEVTWPNGKKQVVKNLEINRLIEISEE